ncbi:MAG TPA: hypothetical protein VJS42_18035 [Steroidobacteraceae bacterium]|nr:hypothetical protein [Steroidobacteraceae bacterium]
MSCYEVGQLRMPVSLLPKLAQLFGVAGDELLGLNSGAGKRGPTPKLQQQIERLHRPAQGQAEARHGDARRRVDANRPQKEVIAWNT